MRNDRILQTTVKNRQQEMKLPPKKKADSWQWNRKSRKTGKSGTAKSLAGAVLAVEGLMLLSSKKADALSKEELLRGEKPELSAGELVAVSIVMTAIFATAFVFSRAIGRYFGGHNGWGLRKDTSVKSEKLPKQ